MRINTVTNLNVMSVLFHEDFTYPTDWSSENLGLQTYQYGNKNLIGRYGSDSGNMYENFTNFPTHDHLTIQFTIYFIDSCNAGEVLQVYLDDQLAWKDSFDYFSSSFMYGVDYPDSIR